ncbi:hypothetical protein [Lysobacter gummosus]|uniref:hypothetical protein n=1 Tax=Lysobacter gummosus TaxID=262324 RepID=UPI003645D629
MRLCKRFAAFLPRMLPPHSIRVRASRSLPLRRRIYALMKFCDALRTSARDCVTRCAGFRCVHRRRRHMVFNAHWHIRNMHPTPMSLPLLPGELSCAHSRGRAQPHSIHLVGDPIECNSRPLC